VSRSTFGSLPWRSRSQCHLAANSCPTHNIVIWSRISKLFHRNDHHIEATCGAHHFGSLPWRSRSQHDLAAKSSLVHNIVIWSRILKLFQINDHHIKTTCHAHQLGRFLEGQGHIMTLHQNCVQPITLLFEVGFWNYFTEMIAILRRRVVRNILVATLKVKVTAWPCSKSRSAHNFVIWSRILKLFHRNDHHIKTMCCGHQLGRFLEVQGHSMTLHQNRVWPITLLFEVGFWNYFTEMITILRRRVARNIWVATLKVKVTAW